MGRYFLLTVSIFDLQLVFVACGNWLGLFLHLKLDVVVLCSRWTIGLVFSTSGSPPLWKLGLVFSEHGSSTVSKKDEP